MPAVVPGAVLPSPGSRRPSLPLLAVGLAGSVGALAVLRHEWWRDEAYTWLLVGASPSVGRLLDEIGSSGHPALYYLLAYALRQLGSSPLLLSLTNLGFSLAAVALFARSAPVPAWQRLLFSVGFFPLFQYGVVARNYSLLLFLVCLYADLAVARPQRRAARLLVLAALAQVHVVAMAVASVLLVRELVEAGVRDAKSRAAAGAVVLSLLLGAWQVVPGSTGAAGLRASSAREVLQGFANGFVPNFGLFGQTAWQLPLGLAIFAASWLVLLRVRRELATYALLVAVVAAVCALFYVGHRWHHGLYLVSFLLCVWLAPALPGWRSTFVGGVLALQALVGAYAVWEDLRLPYSNGPAVARRIQDERLDPYPIVGLNVVAGEGGTQLYTWDIDAVQPVLLHLPEGRAFDPRTGSLDRYWRHYGEPTYFPLLDQRGMLGWTAAMSRHVGKPLVFVAVLPPNAPVPPLPPPFRLVASFPPSLDYGEHLGLLLYPPEPAPAGP
ncbi:hypothetical protein FBQ97_12055 [Acidobacteria bacterium ACD]|nr:MAG: hypothetical protein EDX89_21025 [Acidobacteriota bacterium]MCE7957812.1 hypothetical protein [Acidobacteria bacterium ACB2]MDL1950532.1 hypothetical protein [Acidobacteria bacterium ACD]